MRLFIDLHNFFVACERTNGFLDIKCEPVIVAVTDYIHEGIFCNGNPGGRMLFNGPGREGTGMHRCDHPI